MQALSHLQEVAASPASKTAARVLASIIDNKYLEEKDDAASESWSSVAQVLSHDEQAGERRIITGEQARTLFATTIGRISKPGARSDSSVWSTLLDIADACAGHRENQYDEGMRSTIFDEVRAAVGATVDNQELALQAILFVRAWNWFSDGSPGRKLFLEWFESYLEAEALERALERVQFLDLAVRLNLIERAFARLDPSSPKVVGFANEVGRTLGGLCLWSPDAGPRDLMNRLCGADPRPLALSLKSTWRAFLDGAAWTMANGLSQASGMKDRAKRDQAVDRYVPLATQMWKFWPRAEEEDHNAIAWALLSPLERDYEGPNREWSTSLRPLLLAILDEADRVDLSAALHGLAWSQRDRDTLIQATQALIVRSRSCAVASRDAEETRRPTSRASC